MESPFQKAHIKQHTRKDKSGTLHVVREHEDSREKKVSPFDKMREKKQNNSVVNYVKSKEAIELMKQGKVLKHDKSFGSHHKEMYYFDEKTFMKRGSFKVLEDGDMIRQVSGGDKHTTHYGLLEDEKPSKIKIIDVNDVTKVKMKKQQERLQKYNFKVVSEDEEGIMMEKKKRAGMKKILITPDGKLKKFAIEPFGKTKNGKKDKKEKKNKEKKSNKNPWIAKYGKFGLTRYPVAETSDSVVKVDLSGDIHSKAVMTWRDLKTQKLIHSYTREFMRRNAEKKWNRISALSKDKVESIKANCMKSIDSKNKTVAQSAAIVMIIAETGLRIGTETIFEQTGNRGVSTLSPDNITISGDTISFNFQGKSYQENNSSMKNAKVAKLLQALKNKKKGKDRLFDVEYGDITHEFKHTLAKSKKIKIKDLRTFVASELAVEVLNSLPKIKWVEAKGKNKKMLKEHLKKTFDIVSQRLNNTPGVAKGSYIHPNILQEYLDKIKAPEYLLPLKGGK